MHAPAATVILILELAGTSLSPFARLEDSTKRRACLETAVPAGRVCWSESEWREHLRGRTPRAGPWVARKSGETWEVLGPAPPVATPALPQPPLSAVIAGVERWRCGLSQALRPSDRGGVLRTLLLHEHASEAGPLLKLVGFVHLLNATGLHLMAAFAWSSRALSGIGAILGWSVTASLRAAELCEGIWIALAWTLSGGRFGLLRSVLLIAFRRTARHAGFRWRFWSPLALWAAIEIGVAWSGLGEPGGWVYGLSVAGAVATLWGARKAAHWRMNVGSWAPVALWEGIHNGWIAWATPLLNGLCLPLFAYFLYPAAVGCSVLGWTAGLRAIGSMTSKAAEALAGLALKGDGLWWVPPSAVAIGLGISAVVLLGRAWMRNRWIRAGWTVVPLLVLAGARMVAHREDFEFAAPALLDVGQGDALLVASRRWNALIDAGTATALGDRRWLDALASRGVFHLDALLLTHLDSDHAGGVGRLANLVTIDCVGVPDTQWALPRTREWVGRAREEWGLTVQRASRCSPLPAASLTARARATQRRNSPVPNDAMGAYLVPLEPSGVLVSFGDADRRQERALMSQLKSEIKALGRPLILKVSHHGSKTSSDSEVVRQLAPDEAWISCGARNTYGHPHAWALDRIARAAPLTRVRRTDLEGDVEATAATVRRRR